MARKRLLECSFFIPIRRGKELSDGLPHAHKAWQWLDDQLLAFEGTTRALELYEGWYVDRDTGKWVKDLSRRYLVALERRGVTRLRRLLRQACLVFAQKCIYLSVAGLVEFVERRKQ
jgi:hypothetical protein